MAGERDGGGRVEAGEGEDSFSVSWSTLSFRAGAHPLMERAKKLFLLSKLHFLFL